MMRGPNEQSARFHEDASASISSSTAELVMDSHARPVPATADSTLTGDGAVIVYFFSTMARAV